jgi:hypothetical protein
MHLEEISSKRIEGWHGLGSASLTGPRDLSGLPPFGPEISEVHTVCANLATSNMATLALKFFNLVRRTLRSLQKALKSEETLLANFAGPTTKHPTPHNDSRVKKRDKGKASRTGTSTGNAHAGPREATARHTCYLILLSSSRSRPAWPHAFLPA